MLHEQEISYNTNNYTKYRVKTNNCAAKIQWNINYVLTRRLGLL